MSEKFTPGPWWGEQDGASVVILAKQGPIRVSPGRANSEADAYLMIAAPELYEALQKMVSTFTMLPDDLTDPDSVMGRANAALAKARGEVNG